MAEEQQKNPHEDLKNSYQSNKVNTKPLIAELKSKVRGLPQNIFSDRDRLSLENMLDRIAIEKDPIMALQGSQKYEQEIRANYIATLGIAMRNGKYDDKKDRNKMLRDAQELFEEMNGYKKDEE